MSEVDYSHEISVLLEKVTDQKVLRRVWKILLDAISH